MTVDSLIRKIRRVIRPGTAVVVDRATVGALVQLLDDCCRALTEQEKRIALTEVHWRIDREEIQDAHDEIAELNRRLRARPH